MYGKTRCTINEITVYLQDIYRYVILKTAAHVVHFNKQILIGYELDYTYISCQVVFSSDLTQMKIGSNCASD